MGTVVSAVGTGAACTQFIRSRLSGHQSNTDERGSWKCFGVYIFTPESNA